MSAGFGECLRLTDTSYEEISIVTFPEVTVYYGGNAANLLGYGKALFKCPLGFFLSILWGEGI